MHPCRRRLGQFVVKPIAVALSFLVFFVVQTHKDISKEEVNNYKEFLESDDEDEELKVSERENHNKKLVLNSNSD